MMEREAAHVAEKWFWRILSPLLRRAHADDAGNAKNAENEGAAAPALNFEDLVGKARKEEKDKLYPQIEEWKKKCKALTKANNEHLLAIANLEERAKVLAEQLVNAGKGDAQEVQGLRKSLDDALKLVDGLREELKSKPATSETELRAEIEKEIEAKVRELYEAKLYRFQKLQEAGDDVLVPDLVVGDTKEEIDASLAAAIERTKAIREKLGVGAQGKPADKPRPNPANPAGKGMDSLSGLDPAAIRNMTDEEYSEWRKKAGLGARK